MVPQEFNFNPFETVQQIVVNRQGTTVWSAKKRTSAAKNILAARFMGKTQRTCAHVIWRDERRLMIARALMHEPKLLILDSRLQAWILNFAAQCGAF